MKSTKVQILGVHIVLISAKMADSPSSHTALERLSFRENPTKSSHLHCALGEFVCKLTTSDRQTDKQTDKPNYHTLAAHVPRVIN